MRKKLLPKVFMWLFIGMIFTFLIGYYVSTKNNILSFIYDNNLYWIFIFLQLALAMIFSIKIADFSKPVAIIFYFLFALITGLSISYIFQVYSAESIMIIFLIAAGLFGLFGLIGKFTKLDLSKLWIFLIMGFIGVLILWLINMFVGSEKLSIIGSILGLIVFLGYTAYDVQRIARSDDLEDVTDSNYPILFAFSLYIDFINIFMDLLNLFGDRKN